MMILYVHLVLILGKYHNGSNVMKIRKQSDCLK